MLSEKNTQQVVDNEGAVWASLRCATCSSQLHNQGFCFHFLRGGVLGGFPTAFLLVLQNPTEVFGDTHTLTLVFSYIAQFPGGKKVRERQGGESANL